MPPMLKPSAAVKKTLFALPGAAAPSDLGQAEAVVGKRAAGAARKNAAETKRESSQPVNGLSTLIRREVRDTVIPAATFAAGKAAVEAHAGPALDSSKHGKNSVATAKSPERAVRATPVRRQMTVRLKMAMFRQLDFAAKTKGATYQTLLNTAISEYLDGHGPRADGHGYIKTETTHILERAERRRNLAGKRRRLTVRIDCALFSRLRHIAEATGQTYQDIMVRAVNRYVRRLAGEFMAQFTAYTIRETAPTPRPLIKFTADRRRISNIIAASTRAAIIGARGSSESEHCHMLEPAV